ncbi:MULTISPECIES: hypothetical protein [Methanocorpusculum]|jgi:hypothetical protein|uniref:Uncharacterized protein n=1 Tax=Methanocorpusculum parvum TaxID=2193 RepID=A0AAX0Q774_9EURY|nr:MULTISPECIES: hypothetical protein [Methanocorpusculum]MDD2248541.1 hypothetical protein [Methanocorpusculum sp.]MDD2803005.1 hypothetical protein [Methanocorpusculum sp.]MDD3047071.1 hypothetical protein [Methanocorpusculum sp.]MDD3912261.1 hypothetical protein [Methanocorpusculum sp.]MDD4423326.1 hypothetical protein [Methanocorpusculum parvum]
MDLRIPAFITAVIAVAGASNDQRIIAGIIGAAFVFCTFITLPQNQRVLLLSAAGFPLVFTAGMPVFTGLLLISVMITVLTAAGVKTDTKILLAAAGTGVAGGIFSMQLSVVLPVLAAGIFTLAVLYVIFVRAYRLKKEVEGTNT